VAPSEYFLAAFEAQVVLTQTKDPEVMKKAVSVLGPAGGTENIYSAAQQVLTRYVESTKINLT
jgi:hypothetical protein